MTWTTTTGAALGREPRRRDQRLLRLRGTHDRHDDRPVLDGQRGAEHERRRAHRRAQRLRTTRRGRPRSRGSRPRASRARPSACPAPAPRPRPRRARSRARRRSRTAASPRRRAQVRPARKTSSSSRPAVPEADHRHVGDREREHRAERVHRPEEVVSPGSRVRIEISPAKTSEREPRRLEARVEPAEDLRQLPVARHRVRDPRGPDHARVRRDEEDRRGEDADVDLQRVEQRASSRSRGSRPRRGWGRSGSRPPRAGAEQRLELAADPLDRQRRERDRRQREVDREDRDRDQPDARGTSRGGSRASSARFEIVSIPV